MIRVRRASILIALVVVVAACQSSGSGTPRPRLGGPTAPASAGLAATARPAGPAEPGVIKGRVTDEQGDPVVGAKVRVIGYTGGTNQHDDDLISDAAGEYRIEVADGLYEVLGTGPLTFEGATYTITLRPVDGDCEPRESAGGIVKDLVLPLTGLEICSDRIDPNDTNSYAGAPVSLLYVGPRALPADARVTFTLAPVGALADGSNGSPLTFDRMGAALTTGFGPIDGTSYLPDIPLARYRISGTASVPGGGSQTLRFRLDTTTAPTESVEFGFEPYDGLPYGIRVRKIDVVDAAWTEPTY